MDPSHMHVQLCLQVKGSTLYAVATTYKNMGTASTTCRSPTRLLSSRRCNSGALGAPASGVVAAACRCR